MSVHADGFEKCAARPALLHTKFCVKVEKQALPVLGYNTQAMILLLVSSFHADQRSYMGLGPGSIHQPFMPCTLGDHALEIAYCAEVFCFYSEFPHSLELVAKMHSHVNVCSAM